MTHTRTINRRQRDASNQSRGFSPSISPTSFYPMLSGIPGPEMVERYGKGSPFLDICFVFVPSLSWQMMNSRFFFHVNTVSH